MPVPSRKTRERLSEVRYEIRGELARRARELEGQSRRLIELNIGNPGVFGFHAPEHRQRVIAEQIAYTYQQGLPAARAATSAFHRQRGTPNAAPERVFVGIDRGLAWRAEHADQDHVGRKPVDQEPADARTTAVA